MEVDYCRLCFNHDPTVYLQEKYIKALHVKNIQNYNLICKWCDDIIKKFEDLKAFAQQLQVLILDYEGKKITLDQLKSFGNMRGWPNEEITTKPKAIDYKTNIEVVYVNEPTDNLKSGCETFSDLTNNDINNSIITTSLIDEEVFGTKSVPKKPNHIENVKTEAISHGNTAKKQKVKNKLNEVKGYTITMLNETEHIKEIEKRKDSSKFKSAKYKCDDCCVVFLSESVASRHFEKHSENNGPYNCISCKLYFKSNKSLEKHEKSHRKWLACNKCNKLFKKISRFVFHQNMCSSLNVCSYCHMQFCDDASLKQHKSESHKSERKKNICNYCGQGFPTKYKLNVHLRKHTGERPYECDLCKHTFATKSYLTYHRKFVHRSSKKMYCVECNSYFKTEKSLKRHFKENSMHRNDVGHICTECGLQFKSKFSLTTHTNKDHYSGVANRCSLCDKTFSSSSNLNKHKNNVHKKS